MVILRAQKRSILWNLSLRAILSTKKPELSIEMKSQKNLKQPRILKDFAKKFSLHTSLLHKRKRKKFLHDQKRN